jgi:large subunit ribosomal protein L15
MAQLLRLHHLRPAPGAKKDKIRVGRGDGSKGKTAGRGTKGSGARGTVRPGFEGGQLPLYMRLPKKRGFVNHNRVEYQVVNLDTLSKEFPKGGKTNAEDLARKGIIRSGQGLKVLGNGEISVAVEIEANAVSKSAKEKIESAGGSVSII